MPARRTTAAVLTLLVSLALLAPGAASAAGSPPGVSVLSGSVPQRGMTVTMLAANPGERRPVVLGRARSRAGGGFLLRYRSPSRAAVKYLLATHPAAPPKPASRWPPTATSWRSRWAPGACRAG